MLSHAFYKLPVWIWPHVRASTSSWPEGLEPKFLFLSSNLTSFTSRLCWFTKASWVVDCVWLVTSIHSFPRKDCVCPPSIMWLTEMLLEEEIPLFQQAEIWPSDLLGQWEVDGCDKFLIWAAAVKVMVSFANSLLFIFDSGTREQQVLDWGCSFSLDPEQRNHRAESHSCPQPREEPQQIPSWREKTGISLVLSYCNLRVICVHNTK